MERKTIEARHKFWRQWGIWRLQNGNGKDGGKLLFKIMDLDNFYWNQL